MTRFPVRIGTAIIAASMMSLMSVASAQAPVNSLRKGATGKQVKVCIQLRNASGMTGKNLSREQRIAIRAQYRSCIRAAIMLNNGHASSSSNKTSSSLSSRRSSSVSSASSRSSASSSLSSISSSSSSLSTSSVSSGISSSSSSSHASQSSVGLGATSTFAVLAGSTVTNTGLTTVTGDLGVSPGSAVTGFGPGVVSGGAIHAGDTAAAQAEAALTVAYNDLAGRTTAPVTVAGNQGGSTLSPGLYKSTGSLEISSGDLTLDAKGDANAVFIFQIASTLTVTTGRHVVLAGGAKASNIFWQVGTSATIEANAIFKGSVLADQSISVKTAANIEGRLLARIGGVTLQGNTIVVPN
jgi:hypothetical protein